jgi:hypothetical protein
MENMELIGKLIGVVGAIIALYITVVKHFLSNKPRLREEFEFAEKLVATLKIETHPLIFEKGYEAMTGDNNLSAKEIKHLFTLESPALALRKYSSLKEYLEIMEEKDTGIVKIAFKKKYSETTRLWLEKAYFALYVIFAILAFSPIVFGGEMFGIDWKSAIILALFFLCTFGILAVQFILEFKKLRSSDEIVNMLSVTELSNSIDEKE